MSMKLNTKKATLAAAISLLSAAGFAKPGFSLIPARHVSASESQEVSLTIYNQNFGLVRDIREVVLNEGRNLLQFEDVAAQIDPTTVSFSSLTAPNAVTVREQNYQYDLINPATILAKSIGKTAKFKRLTANGQMEEFVGTLLNSQGLVLKTASGVLLNPQGEIELAELPPGLVSKPSLLWKLDAGKPGKHKTEIAYQTRGLDWHCDYVVVANADDTSADLTAWVTLDNKSGATYKNAALKLLAGDVHRIQHAMGGFASASPVEKSAAAEPQFTEKAFAEYHLYKLQGKTDVNNNETKQLTLFSTNNVSTAKSYIYEPEMSCYAWGDWFPSRRDPQKVNVKLEIENKAANHLGMPMPKGKVRVYKRDDDGLLQFIGEDMIDHTAKDEKVRIYIGDAFDLVGQRRETNFTNVSSRVRRASYEIELRNHKDSDVTINAVEHSYGQWKVLSSSHPYKRKDSRSFEFAVKVPANGAVKINYDIEVRS